MRKHFEFPAVFAADPEMHASREQQDGVFATSPWMRDERGCPAYRYTVSKIVTVVPVAGINWPATWKLLEWSLVPVKMETGIGRTHKQVVVHSYDYGDDFLIAWMAMNVMVNLAMEGRGE